MWKKYKIFNYFYPNQVYGKFLHIEVADKYELSKVALSLEKIRRQTLGRVCVKYARHDIKQ